MCTELFLMIRYKTNGMLCALTSPVHCCAWITSYMFYNSYCNYLIILVKQTSRQINALFSIALHRFLGLAVSTPVIGRVDLCSSPKGESNITRKKDIKIFLEYFCIIRIIRFILIICRSMLSYKHWNCKNLPNARGILVCSIVWWLDWNLDTPSTKVCSEYTAIRFLLNRSMAVTDWTSSW